MNTLETKILEAQKRFDEKFTKLIGYHSMDMNPPIVSEQREVVSNPDSIKKFIADEIRLAVSQERKQIAEEIRRINKDLDGSLEDIPEKEFREFNRGWNSATRLHIQKINTLLIEIEK